RFLFLTPLVFLISSCADQTKGVDFDAVQVFVSAQLEQAIEKTEMLTMDPLADRKAVFAAARLAFKKAEPFAAYLHPEAAHRVNGPPLPVFREDNSKVLPSVGFQAIEELIYIDEEPDTVALRYKVDITLGYLRLLKDRVNNYRFTPQRFFVPMHQQLLRIYSLGLTGFDTPGSYLGMNESARLLETFGELYTLALGDTVQQLSADLHVEFLNELSKAVSTIDSNPDFETFDRYTFGRNHLNKLTELWVSIRKVTGLYPDPKLFALNLDAASFFEEDAFNVDFFRSSYNRNPSDDQILLGKRLFNDVRLSTSGNLACATCHQPGNGYQDGARKGIDKNGNPLLRNTPTIINAIYQKKFFWDGRADNLEQQITGVFENKVEFD
ncbi:MAG: cytochrome c peroxidase, partial [Bacteroidota bacterium]